MNSKQYSLSTYAHREVGASVQLSTYVENDVGFGKAICTKKHAPQNVERRRCQPSSTDESFNREIMILMLDCRVGEEKKE